MMTKKTLTAALLVILSASACEYRSMLSTGQKSDAPAEPTSTEIREREGDRESAVASSRQPTAKRPSSAAGGANRTLDTLSSGDSAAAVALEDEGAGAGRASRSGPQATPAQNSGPVRRLQAEQQVRAEQKSQRAVRARSAETAKSAPAGGVVYGHALIAFNQQPDIRQASEPLDRERYGEIEDNPVKRVADHPVSTFSIDVDTGAYANVRRYLHHGRLPPMDAVRVEEMINYFAYDYPAPGNREQPFSVTTRVAPAPWSDDRYLLHIGIKGYEVPAETLPPANLVFLIDVSGSMRSANKLDLLKKSLKLFSRQLRAVDRLSIVVYAGASGVVLEPVPGDRGATIEGALDGLHAGGSTNGGAGIRLAYAKAREAYIDGGINRVILATDGDFNVGTVDFDKLKNLVERERRSGVSLTTLGFGSGNYNEHLMEQLANAGNGNHAYIDTLKEANKVLVQQMSGTLNTIAKDVKIQIEFNSDRVAEYRLIGYENRVLRREDFKNDKVDAGEIGAGHTVTALYEITFAGSESRHIDPLRYAPPATVPRNLSDEIAFLRIRHKAPGGDESRLSEWPIHSQQVQARIGTAGADFGFAAAVAGFGQLLRGGRYTGDFGYQDVLALARRARTNDPFGYRSEFLSLVSLAESLDRPSR